MALPTTYVGTTVALYLREGTSPTFTYSRPCGLTSHTITFSKQTNEIVIPDCDDLEAAAWVGRGVESLDLSGSGSGVLAAEAVEKWWDAFASEASIPVRIYIGAPDDTTNGHMWTGNIHLTQFEVTGERGGKAQVNISFASDGEMTHEATT